MSDNNLIISSYKFRNDLYSVFILIVMISLITLICWFLLSSLDRVWLLFVLFVTVLSWPKFSQNLILNAYNTHKIQIKDNYNLLTTIESLSVNAGLIQAPDVYSSDVNGVFSFTMKVDGEYIIVISNALIESLNENETTAVLAHEISHIYHDDINVTVLSDRMSQLIQTLSAIGLIMLTLSPLFSVQYSSSSWGLILFLFFSYFLSNLLQLSLSRSREFYADVIAVQLTSDVSAMVSALNKIEINNRNWLTPIVNPYNKMPSYLRSHPSTHERVRRLHGLDMYSSFNSNTKPKPKVVNG